MQAAEIERRFTYHAPVTSDRATAHATLRGACAGLAAQIADLCPTGREQALAMTKLEETMFWANAAIARAGSGDG